MKRHRRVALATMLVAVLVAGVGVVAWTNADSDKTWVTAYFDNSNGIYPGDEIRILGVPVGEIESIEPQPQRARVTFWLDNKYQVPADVSAVILSPSLVTARAIQLTPAYTQGPVLQDHAVLPQNRTAVPVEWDQLRTQLDRLSQTLQPTTPGGVSTLGAFVNTVADNLRGQGSNIRDTVINLSQSLSILSDHSEDVFGSVENLAVLVSALHDSADLTGQLNRNLAAVTALLANDPNEVGQAVSTLHTAATDVSAFVAENRDALGVTSDRLSEVTAALGASLEDVEQALHLMPSTLANYVNIYQPAQGAVTGILAGNNFSNPIEFLCGAIQAASRQNAEQSAKLCVQYLAPIVKNRQYNYLLPLGFNAFVGAMARPNEVTFSEDWLRPDFVPPAPQPPNPRPATADAAGAETTHGDSNFGVGHDVGPPRSTDPAAGLTGLMVPQGSGS